MIRTLQWEGIDDVTSEFCTIENTQSGMSVSGIITGSINAVPISIDYQIQLTGNWLVRSFVASNRHTDFAFQAHQLSSGKWFDKDNKPLQQFDGCIDIDLFPTPFTNSLPLKRQPLQPGESRTFSMIWIDLQDGVIRVDRQRYTSTGNSVFRFDSLDTGFSTEIVFTNDLYVKYYPDLFRLV